MSRDILMNKWVLGGLGFLILFAGLCYLWYQYTTAPYREQAAELDEMIQQSERQRTASTAKRTEQAADAPVDSNTPTAEKPVTETTGAKTNTSTDETTKSVTAATQETDKTKEIRVSPHGFGPYPEVPEDFISTLGTPSIVVYQKYGGNPPSRNHELMQRVMVELWKQGHTDVEAAFMDGDKVRVHFKNRAYVRYSTITTVDGRKVRYISSWRAGKSVSQPQPQPGDVYPPGERDISPGVKLIDMDKEQGIDPYEFLGLN